MSREQFEQGIPIVIAVLWAVLTIVAIYSRRKKYDLLVAIPGKANTILVLVHLPFVGAWLVLWLSAGRPLTLHMFSLLAVFFAAAMAWLERYRPINGLGRDGVITYGVLTPWSSIKSYEFVGNVLQMRLSHMRTKMRIPTTELPIAKELLASVDELSEARRLEPAAAFPS